MSKDVYAEMLHSTVRKTQTLFAKRIGHVLRSPHTRALVFKSAVAAAIAWFVTSRLSSSAAENLAFGLLVIAGVASMMIAWAVAGMFALWAYLVSSLDDSRNVARTVLAASAPATWLPAGIVLLSALTLATTVASLLMIANVIRILVSRIPLSTSRYRHRRSRSGTPLSRYGSDGSLAQETLTAFIGGFAIHAAAAAVWSNHALLAAAFVVLGAIAFTVSARMRTSARPVNYSDPRRTAVGALIAFILAASISLDQSRFRAGHLYDNALAESRLAWDRLAYGRQPQSAPVKKSATKLTSTSTALVLPAKGLVPGVILRPDKPQAQSVVLPHYSRGGRLVSGALVLPFTGEYHLFPTSSERVQPDSAVYRGTPLEAVYKNVGGGPIETQAYQQLNPSIDFTNCDKVRLTLRHGEVAPALASLELIGTDGAEDLGSEVFALERTSEETLDFDVPNSSRLARVTAIRVGFRCDPSRRSESTRVAIVQFTLVPRNL